MNVLENALRFSSPADPVELEVGSTGDDVLVTIDDRGPGLDPDSLERIFEPFEHGRAGGEGTGLGLAIARGFAEANGCRLWAEPRPGSGASFTLASRRPRPGRRSSDERPGARRGRRAADPARPPDQSPRRGLRGRHRRHGRAGPEHGGDAAARRRHPRPRAPGRERDRRLPRAALVELGADPRSLGRRRRDGEGRGARRGRRRLRAEAVRDRRAAGPAAGAAAARGAVRRAGAGGRRARRSTWRSGWSPSAGGGSS